MPTRRKSKHAVSTEHLASLRLPRDLVDRADALIPLVAKDASVTAVGSVRRSAVLRLAILRGLEALEAKYAKKQKKESSR